MIRKILLLFILICISMAFVGCSNSNTHSITTEGATADKSRAATGESVTLVLDTPNGGTFASWNTTGIAASDIRKVSSNEYQFTMPAGNVVVKAIYDIDPNYSTLVDRVMASISKTKGLTNYEINSRIEETYTSGEKESRYSWGKYNVSEQSGKSGINEFSPDECTYMLHNVSCNGRVGVDSVTGFNWSIFASNPGVKYIQLAGIKAANIFQISSSNNGNKTAYIFSLRYSATELSNSITVFDDNSYSGISNIKFELTVNSEGNWEKAALSFDFSSDSKRGESGSLKAETNVNESIDKIEIPDTIKNQMINYENQSKIYTHIFPNQVSETENKYEPNVPGYSTYTDVPGVKYLNTDEFIKVLFDPVTNLIAFGYKDKVDFYDVDTLRLSKTLRFTELDNFSLTDFDIDNGRIAISSFRAKSIALYSIETIELLQSIGVPGVTTTADESFQLAFDNDKVYYALSTGSGLMRYWDLNSGYRISYNEGKPIGNAKLILDRENHILNVYEIYGGVIYVYRIDSIKGTIISNYAFLDDESNPLEEWFYDGAFAHLNGFIFDSSGALISKVDMSYPYTPLSSFTPYKTLCSTQNIDVVRGCSNGLYYTALYDKSMNGYTLKLQFYASGAISLGNGKFGVIDSNKGCIAVIDFSNRVLLGGNSPHDSISVTKTTSGNNTVLKLVTPSNAIVNKTVVTDRYIYLMVSSLNCIVVVNRTDYSIQRILRYLCTPEQIAASNSVLVVYFSNSNYVSVVETGNWSETMIGGVDEIIGVEVYDDLVYYTVSGYSYYIYAYDCHSKEMNRITVPNARLFVKVFVNHERGTVYYTCSGSKDTFGQYIVENTFVELYQGSYMNKDGKKVSEVSMFGRYALIDSKIFDLDTQYLFTDEQYNSIVPEWFKFSSDVIFSATTSGYITYYDGTYTCFVQNGNTTVYDSIQGKVITTLNGVVGNVQYHDGSFYVLNENSSSVVISSK